MEAIAGALQTVINFFKAIWDAIQKLFEWLNDAYEAFIEFVMNFPEWLFAKVADSITGFFDSIPVPPYFSGIQNVFSAIPSEVIFFTDAFKIGYGVSVILSAFFLRFVIRRLPLVG